jgi:hypothetical protein
MYARVTTFTIEPGHVDDTVATLRDGARELEAVDGFKGVRLLTGVDAGKSFAVTYWDSPEHMQGSTDAIAPVRDRMLQVAGGGGATAVDQCEVVFDSLAARA